MPVAWESGEDKTLSLLNKVRSALSAEDIVAPKDAVRRYAELLEETDWKSVEGKPKLPLVPVEDVRSYPLKPRLSKSPEELLAEMRASVAAIDSSSFFLGAHIKVPIAVGNVGYWGMNYAEFSGFSGNVPEVFKRLRSKIEIQTKLRELEMRAAGIAAGKLSGDLKVFMLDEALNLGYTASWSARLRREMAELTRELLERISGEGAVPIGVFYTRAADIARAVCLAMGKNPEEEVLVSDRVLMDAYLKLYHRSPLMAVKSKVLAASGMSLYAIYVKLGEGNVLRVEIPAEHIDKVEEVHAAVVLTSLLGGGYPLPLQRAHERAVITREERELIIREIMRMFRIPEIEYLLSRKEVRKRWPIA